MTFSGFFFKWTWIFTVTWIEYLHLLGSKSKGMENAYSNSDKTLIYRPRVWQHCQQHCLVTAGKWAFSSRKSSGITAPAFYRRMDMNARFTFVCYRYNVLFVLRRKPQQKNTSSKTYNLKIQWQRSCVAPKQAKCNDGTQGRFRVHKRFRELRPDLIPKEMTENDAVAIPVPYESIERLPELRVTFR